jgi:transcriptional regulator with PAS, ATPase and Fis domain
LRERKEDIPLFIEAFIKRYSGGRPITISSQAMNFLLDYNWPGNVRELENLIERLALIAPGGDITPAHLPPEIQDEDLRSEDALEGDGSFVKALKNMEWRLIRRALETAGGNKAKAARLLKIKPSTLRSKIEKYNR